MITLALYLFKASLCSGLLYAYYHLGLRNKVFHQYNRFYLLGTVAASLVFPLLTLPSFFQEETHIDTTNWQLFLPRSSQGVPHQPTAILDMDALLLGAYLLVTCVLLLGILRGTWQLFQMMQQHKIMQYNGVKVYLTNHALAPFSFFNKVFWKNDIDLNTPEGSAIFRHELAHIKARHSIDKLLMQLVVALCWINPFFWIIRRELQQIHEFVADQEAARNSDASALARMILQTVYGNHYASLINPFFQQPIKRRLSMLHKTFQKPRNADVGRLLALPVAAVILLLVAQKRAVAAENEPAPLQTIPVYNLADTLPNRDTANIREMHVDAANDSMHRITITYKDGRKVSYNEKKKPVNNQNNQALVIIDGKVVGTMAEIGDLDKKLKPSEIASVQVWKGDKGIERYGEKGKNGVIEITTLANSKAQAIDASQPAIPVGTTRVAPEQIKPKNDAGAALLVVDGKEMGRMSDFENGKLPVKEALIESMNVLKDKKATDKYGEKGKNGVIELTMKKQ